MVIVRLRVNGEERRMVRSKMSAPASAQDSRKMLLRRSGLRWELLDSGGQRVEWSRWVSGSCCIVWSRGATTEPLSEPVSMVAKVLGTEYRAAVGADRRPSAADGLGSRVATKID